MKTKIRTVNVEIHTSDFSFQIWLITNNGVLVGILYVIRFERGSSLSISILQHGFQENILQREDRNNEYTSCHFFNFYFEPKIQSGCMLVTHTVKYIIFYQCFVCYVLVPAAD